MAIDRGGDIKNIPYQRIRRGVFSEFTKSRGVFANLITLGVF